MNWAASAFVATVVKQSLQVPASLFSRTRGSIALIERAQRASASNLLSSIVMTIARLNVINNGLQVDELQQVLVKFSRTVLEEAIVRYQQHHQKGRDQSLGS